MSFKSVASAALVTVVTATTALAQSGEIKGWTPRAQADQGGAKAPAAGGGDAAPRPPIARGPGDPAPRPPGGVAGTPTAPGAIAAQPPATAGGAQADYTFMLATDPAHVQRVMQNAGYRAEMSTDDQGNPKIIGSISNSTYWVMFLDCGLDIGCAGLQFFVGYSSEYKPSLEAVNDFNNQYRYVRASVADNGNPMMYMDIIVRDGGISEDAFRQYLGLWSQFVPAFEEMIGW